MFNSRDDAMLKNASRAEMVTPSFTGNLHGDPRRGRTRLLTNNVCTGTSYYLGTQANGSRFLDRNGLWRFDGPGEQGMIDWGAIVVNQTAVALGKTGTDALATSLKMVPGTCHAPYSMPRVLGDPSGQTVATSGRKIMIGWIGNGSFASQSLPRELSLSPLSGALIQRWVPELRALRVSGAVGGGFQMEIFARMFVSRSAQGLSRRFGVRVLVGPSGEGTDIGVDMDSRIVFIDGRNSGSCDAIPWQCDPHTPSGHKGLYPAGPLLGNSSVIEVHCYVDAVYVSCIFNNQTAITAMVAPSARAIDPATTFGSGATVQLQTWRLALDTDSKVLVPDRIAQEIDEQSPRAVGGISSAGVPDTPQQNPKIIFVTRDTNNDVLGLLKQAVPPPPTGTVHVAATAVDALKLARAGDTIAFFADGFPREQTRVPPSFWSSAAARDVNVVLEFPAQLPINTSFVAKKNASAPPCLPRANPRGEEEGTRGGGGGGQSVSFVYANHDKYLCSDGAKIVHTHYTGDVCNQRNDIQWHHMFTTDPVGGLAPAQCNWTGPGSADPSTEYSGFCGVAPVGGHPDTGNNVTAVVPVWLCPPPGFERTPVGGEWEGGQRHGQDLTVDQCATACKGQGTLLKLKTLERCI